MSDYRIDINADVGEGIGNEVELLPLLSSCNIACGGHASDYNTMTEVVRLAKQHEVKIGVHPSFPDRDNFGRVVLKLSEKALYNSLKAQISNFLDVLNEQDTSLHHIKPHGALYNLAAKDEVTASVIVEVVNSLGMPVKLYAPYKSVMASLAEQNGIEVIYEAFADRNYNTDLSLVSRNYDNAILHNETDVLEHVLRMVKDQNVLSIQGEIVPLKATTFCVHGDTKNALQILKYLRQELPRHNILFD